MLLSLCVLGNYFFFLFHISNKRPRTFPSTNFCRLGEGDGHFYTWFETGWTRALQRFTVRKINGLCELSNFIMCPNQNLSLMFDRIMIKYFKIKNADLRKNCCWPCQGSFNTLKEYQQPLSDIKLQQMLPNQNIYRRQLVIHTDRALIKPCCQLSVKWIPATESWLWNSLHAQSLICHVWCLWEA